MSQTLGEGVHNVYKERAHKGGDVLWHVTIKGQKELTEGIPLHMSLKVFDDKKDMDLVEIKRKVKQFKIEKPNPEKLKFKTTVFTSQIDGNKYYMLLVEGCDPSYKEFYDSMKHCGTVYKEFMAHVTIDKGLYDKINEEGLKPREIKFSELTIEAGAGNTIHEFRKSAAEDVDLMREAAWYVNHIRDSIVLSLTNEQFKNWLDDNPMCKKEILDEHEKRAHFHFGQDEQLYKHALFNGILKTYEFARKK